MTRLVQPKGISTFALAAGANSEGQRQDPNAGHTDDAGSRHAGFALPGGAVQANHVFLHVSVFFVSQRQPTLVHEEIVANPARVVELVKLLREYLVRIFGLRLSCEECNDEETVLYGFDIPTSTFNRSIALSRSQTSFSI